MNKDLKRKSRAICLDGWEKQIIYGALLGNAFIVDPPKGLHCYMVIRQSKKQDFNTFLYKTTELKAFARQSPIYADNHDYRWTSISHQDFDLIKNFCYKNKKKHVTMEWLNVLRDVSLMVWYLDRGFYKDGKLGINTVNLKGSQNVIKQYFNEVGMPCELKGTKLIFNDKGKLEFLRVIAHRTPPLLYYRLEESKALKVDSYYEESFQNVPAN
jgi:hypothetical protein